MYYKNASAIILVYDSTSMNSFKALQSWMDEIDDNATEDLLLVAVTASKCDQISWTEVTNEEAIRFAKDNDCFFAETSAKINEGVTELFWKIARKLYYIHHNVRIRSFKVIIDLRPR
jgi:GTPase SAR1 family protein